MRSRRRLLLLLSPCCLVLVLLLAHHPLCGANESVVVDVPTAGQGAEQDENNENDEDEAVPSPMRILNERMIKFAEKKVEEGQQQQQQKKTPPEHMEAMELEEEHDEEDDEEEDEEEESEHRLWGGAKEKTTPEEAEQEAEEIDTDEDESNDGASQHEDHRLWGGGAKEKTTHEEQQQQDENQDSSPSSPEPQPQQQQQKNLPFIPKHPGTITGTAGLGATGATGSGVSTASHSPPKGYVIAARVYIDPIDKLAHLDTDEMTLPYWDCGVTGSTTFPLAIKEATFRHSLSLPSTQTSSWSGTDGKHALLAVALSPLVLEVSSGESQTIQTGQVVLLEDVLVPGHKFRPVNQHQDLQVLFLTLPEPHYHTGKEQVALHASALTKTKADHPCPVKESPDELLRPPSSPNGEVAFFHGKRVRRWLFGLVGMSLSTLVADFLGKTAPLWLAAGIGGTCFVVAGTALSVFLGETSWINLEAWYQQRRLRETTRSASPPVEPREHESWQHAMFEEEGEGEEG